MRRIGSRMIGRFMKVKCYRVAISLLVTFSFIFVADISGIFRHLQEKSFEAEFSYPLESSNFIETVEAFRLGKELDTPPINNLYSGFTITSELAEECTEDHHYPLLILVKSAPSNYHQRQAIRQTWKLSALEFQAKTVFFIGSPNLEDVDEESKLFKALAEESNLYKDIVRLGFQDSYYNNTIKAMLEMRWAVEMCSNFDHALLIDDDYFLSIKNLLKFIHTPLEYPSSGKSEPSKTNTQVDRLYAGYRMFPPPHRHKILTKWFVSLDEYPYDYFPPYITAGAVLLSKNALVDIYYASFYTAHFRFDDVFVAICAKKMNITPVHSEYFRFWSTRDESPEEFLIASHGFSESERLERFWSVQKSHGYC